MVTLITRTLLTLTFVGGDAGQGNVCKSRTLMGLSQTGVPRGDQFPSKFPLVKDWLSGDGPSEQVAGGKS